MAYAQIDPGASFEGAEKRKWEMGVTCVFLLLLPTSFTNRIFFSNDVNSHLTRSITTNLDWLISLASNRLSQIKPSKPSRKPPNAITLQDPYLPSTILISS